MSDAKPLTPSNSVPIGLVYSLLAGARFHRVDIEQLLKLQTREHKVITDLLAELLENPASEQRVDLACMGALLTSLWQIMDDEGAGFLDRPLREGTFAMMCHATITSPNLRRALLRSGRFIALINDDLKIELEENGDEASLIFNFKNRNQLDERFFISSLFILWLRWSCWLINKPILLDRIHFGFDKPDYADEFSEIFACKHYFSQPCHKLVFNTRFLELPLAQDSQSAAEFLRNAPACLLSQYRSDDSFTAKIRRLLQDSDSADNVENLSFEQIAEHFATTTHTLRRRLKEEGNSFQEIKDSIRRQKAIYLLNQAHISVQEIAEKMGFSEAAAFNRAFKKWTGQSPGAYREKALLK